VAEAVDPYAAVYPGAIIVPTKVEMVNRSITVASVGLSAWTIVHSSVPLGHAKEIVIVDARQPCSCWIEKPISVSLDLIGVMEQLQVYGWLCWIDS